MCVHIRKYVHVIINRCVHTHTYVNELCSLPQDYHTLLFGMSRGSIPSFLPLSHALCLPVSLGEVLDSFQHQDDGMGIRYFVVDSRPVDHFSKGHLQHSFHLDANLVSVQCVTGAFVTHVSAYVLYVCPWKYIMCVHEMDGFIFKLKCVIGHGC